MIEMPQQDVIIIGAGVVGLTLAHGLTKVIWALFYGRRLTLI